MLIVRGGAETEKGDSQRERLCVYKRLFFLGVHVHRKSRFLLSIGLSRRESES